MARKSGRGKAKGGGAGKARQYVRDNSGRFASSPGGGGKKAAAKPKAKPAAKTPAKPKAPPKTTTARGRARTKAAEARKALKAGAGTKAARSLAIAQKAADYYKATGTGTKRKPARAAAKPAAKPAAKSAAKLAAAPKAAKPRAAAKPAGGRQSTKVDLSDAGFTRRLSRAKSKLKQAESEFEARGSSIYDTKARNRVSILQSAVDSLSFARKTVRNNTVPANKIKTTDQAIIQNYNNQLAAVKRRSASTPMGTRGSTAPKLTRSGKAAATRAKNKAAREAEQRKRWERSRR